MQISKNFYFVLILHLILGKVTKVLVEKLSTSEVISQKPLGGGGREHLYSAFRVKKAVAKLKLYQSSKNETVVYGIKSPFKINFGKNSFFSDSVNIL